MKKRIFTIEIDCPSDWKNLDACQHIRAILWSELVGVYGRKKATTFPISVVEQNVERPKDQQKMVDLLVKTCEVIDAYERDDKTDSLDNLSGEIWEFLDGRQ